MKAIIPILALVMFLLSIIGMAFGGTVKIFEQEFDLFVPSGMLFTVSWIVLMVYVTYVSKNIEGVDEEDNMDTYG